MERNGIRRVVWMPLELDSLAEETRKNWGLAVQASINTR